MASTQVSVHGGYYDCSELVRMCYVSVGVLPRGSYMWTGNEIELLTSHGFSVRSLSSPQVGDVLWREGHTEMYLGDGMQGGARIDEVGGVAGPRQGDQTGEEIARSAYRPSSWQGLLRYEGGKSIGGIPCAIAAALVMGHIIDHQAHGYSQPNRAGDGTIEAVTITWDEPKRKPADFRWKFDRDVRVRKAPSIKAEALSTRWHKGDVMHADGIWIADGCTWGTYIGPTTGLRLYAAMTQNGTQHGGFA